MNHFTRYTCALFALSLTACTDITLTPLEPIGPASRVQATIVVESEDPDDPETVDFGQVPAGETATQRLIVRNVGTDTLTVQDLRFESASFALVGELETRWIAPDGAVELTVAYTPTRDETVASRLNVSSNDRARPLVPVALLAEGLAPAVRVTPESFDFGSPEIGCSNTLEVEVSNVGRAPLTISAFEFDDLSQSGELVPELPSGGIVLAPGAPPVVIPVHHVPANTEPDSAVLTVVSDDPARPRATSTWFGIAEPGEFHTDAFAQLGDNTTDVLFVVDDSGSMGQEQTSLATNFSSFVQIVDALQVDYHLGVTTTDTGTCSNLQGSTPIVTPSTPDPTGTFAANVDLGTSGSANEQGLVCGQMALQNPANDAFLRPEGGLRVIFVSDEDDHSPGVVSDYVQYFQSLKDQPEKVVLSDISGGLAGCQGGGGNASTGSRYVAASVATGGVSASICDSNWVATLSALAWLSQSLADTFELSRQPIEDTLEVRLNGVNVYVGWTFNSALNAVVFDPSHIPEDGDDIEIEYSVRGACGD